MNGVAIGTCLGAIVALAVPDLGPAVCGGIAAALGAAAVGTLFGGRVGALVGP